MNALSRLSSFFNSSGSSRESEMSHKSWGATSKASSSYSREHGNEGSGTGPSTSGKRTVRSQQRRSTTPMRAESPATPSPLDIAVPLVPDVPEMPRSIEEVQAVAWRENSGPESKRKTTEERPPAKRSRRDSGKVHSHELWALPAQASSSDTRPSTDSTPPRKESRLREKFHTRESSKTILKQEKEALTIRLRELSELVRGADEREKHWDECCKRLEHDLERSEAQHQRTKEDVEAMVENNRATVAHLREVQSHNSRLESRVRELEDQLQRSKAKHGETSALLNVRSAELKGAQVFLSKADLYAGGEIIQMINGLNEEIFQCCANIAEAVIGEQEKFVEEESTLAGCRKEMIPHIGQRMITLLETSREAAEGDTLPLQTALQILLVAQCHELLTAFDIENTEVNKKLALIYEGTYLNDEQAVAGRWRSITMTHLRTLQSTTRIPNLTRHICQTLVLAGYSRQSPSYRPLVASLKGGDNSRLAPIEKGLWMVRQAIGEGVTSCDIMPLSFAPAQPFDAGVMEDMYPDEDEHDVAQQRRARKRGSMGNGAQTPSPSDEKAKGLPVLGTVQLGVQKVTSVRSEGRMIRHKEFLLRPKVILARTLEDQAGR